MRSTLITLLALLTSALASPSGLETCQLNSLLAFSSLAKRQTTLCTPVPAPATCERSCGPDFRTCVSFPTCYNPSRGDSCCSNGEYCPSGYYCTDAGCCPNGTPLASCGATITLSVIPPPPPAQTPSAPPASSAAVTTTSTQIITSTFTSTAVSTVVASSSPSSPSSAVVVVSSSVGSSSAETSSASVVVPVQPTGSVNATVSLIPPPQQTVNAGSVRGVEWVGLVLGGLGAVVLV